MIPAKWKVNWLSSRGHTFWFLLNLQVTNENSILHCASQHILNANMAHRGWLEKKTNQVQSWSSLVIPKPGPDSHINGSHYNLLWWFCDWCYTATIYGICEHNCINAEMHPEMHIFSQIDTSLPILYHSVAVLFYMGPPLVSFIGRKPQTKWGRQLIFAHMVIAISRSTVS